MISKEKELTKLIDIIRGISSQPSTLKNDTKSDNEAAIEAINIVRQKGWLEDGTLKGRNLSGSDLSKAKLKGANFASTTLNYVDFSDANLMDVDLSTANLRGSILYHSNLTKATMFETDLTRVVLSYANLKKADLGYAILNETKLFKTNFQDAKCGSTIFAHVSLVMAKNLETVQHYGHSTLGIDTIYRSKGEIPEIFLLGCGVPKFFIDSISRLIAETPYHNCVISYSRKDTEFLEKFRAKLSEQGVSYWYDNGDLQGGASWADEIHRAIQSADKFLLLCSENSLKDSYWVKREIEVAIQREEEHYNQHKEDLQFMIPIVLDDYIYGSEFKNSGMKASILHSRQAFDFRGWKDNNALFEREIKKVMSAVY